jgi:hypothetical protein
MVTNTTVVTREYIANNVAYIQKGEGIRRKVNEEFRTNEVKILNGI